MAQAAGGRAQTAVNRPLTDFMLTPPEGDFFQPPQIGFTTADHAEMRNQLGEKSGTVIHGKFQSIASTSATSRHDPLLTL